MPTTPAADAADVSVTELIALGRDREAVDAATRDADGTGRQGDPMDGVQQLDEIMPLLRELVDGIKPEQLDAPTPCASFTVTSVLEHMIGGVKAFAPGFRGDTGGAAGAGGEAPGADAPLPQTWHHAMTELTDAMHTTGAQERTMATPLGEVPGGVFARYVAFDGLIHGWDLAVATGQSYEPRPELVAEVGAFARGLLKPEMRDGDMFAAETEAPAGASPLEQLVAFSGRTIPKEA
jgi:uncharacterized protein (TIGR03086 family)